MSTNRDLVNLFREMARMLEMEGVEWKPRAYRQAAYGIEDLSKDVTEIYEKGGKRALEEIPGVGESIADHIIEYIEKGKIEKFEKLREKYPSGLTDLISIEGIGPKKAERLAHELKISSLKDLEKAAREHRIRRLEGFGEKAEENILEALEAYREGHERMLISVALPIAEEIVSYLKENSPLKRIDYVGSLRRMKETIGDVDLLAISDDPEKVMDAFTQMKGVKKVISKGTTRSSIVLKELKELNVQADIRVIQEPSYAAALQYFTGSKEHNIATRKEAIKRGYKLSEYGLFEDSKPLPIKSEEEIYRKLGMDYISPELRENRGEIEAAKKGTLPKLVSLEDIRGDFHLHTKYSDGSNSIEEMVKASQEKGYEYIAITDHSPSARVAGGMSKERIKEQWKEIDGVAKKYEIKVLKGAEVNILKKGDLDYPKEILEELNIVIGSVHSHFKIPKREMTGRILKALESEFLDILGHPTGRLIGKRPPYEVDFPAIFEAAAGNGKVLEIDGQPERLDLNDSNILAAKKQGAKFCIDTDSKSTSTLASMRYGLGMARRGWLTKEDVVNTYPYDRLKKVFKRL